MTHPQSIIADIAFNAQGLVPAIAQDWSSGEVLMLAWMNRDALALTLSEGRAVYWSRSRQALWSGIACHTGRRRCFYRVFRDGEWQVTDEVLKTPETIYGNTQ